MTSGTAASFADVLGLNGKKIAFFGCAHGFGKTLAEAYGQAGALLYLFDRDPIGVECQKTIVEAGGTAEFTKIDITNAESMEQIFSKSLQSVKLDGLIYMPRAREERDFQKVSKEMWDRDLNIALSGAFFCVQKLLPYFSKEQNRDRFILFMSSVLSEVIGTESVGYHVAKAGLDQLTRYLAVKLGPSGIRANSVQIGLVVKGQSSAEFYSDDNFDLRRNLILTHPLRRVGSIQDLINAAYFLSSPLSGFVTGQQLCLDGGLILQEPIQLLSQFNFPTQIDNSKR